MKFISIFVLVIFSALSIRFLSNFAQAQDIINLENISYEQVLTPDVDLEKIGLDRIKDATLLPEDRRFIQENFSHQNYLKIPECWSSPEIYYDAFPSMKINFIFQRTHLFRNLKLHFFKGGQTDFCLTTITPIGKNFSQQQAYQIADIVARVNGFNLKDKIRDNKKEIVFVGERLEIIDGQWLDEISLKKDKKGKIRKIIFYLPDI